MVALGYSDKSVIAIYDWISMMNKILSSLFDIELIVQIEK